MNISIQQLFVCITLTLLASAAPYYLKKYTDNSKKQDLFMGILLFILLVYFIYYSFKIKISFLLTVISYKVFPLIFLFLISFFIFKEFKLTLKKILSLFAIVIGIYFLET